MGTISIQPVAVFAVTSFAGALMLLQGISVHLLEQRPARCRVCGGVVHRTCTCNCGD
jgi:hypothetical protein